MKILFCHNYYQQRGGEDQSFDDEVRLLEAHGHEVATFTLHNDAIRGMHSGTLVQKTLWNRQAKRSVRELIREMRPDVMHCTNTFPLISPSVYYAARAEKVPVVQSLRNYRFLCPNAILLRKGRICNDCVGKTFAWPAVLHGCYRNSRTASAVAATMLGMHRVLGTWRRAVDLYYTLTHFSRDRFVAAGLPAERIMVKPNFIDPDTGFGPGAGGYAVFAGRLAPEKGIETLLAAWERLREPIPLRIIGTGPLESEVRAAEARDPRIRWLGHQPIDQVYRTIGNAACLVMPSVWYETFGRTIAEAFAKGTPVVASRLGAMEELVSDGRTGRLFESANPDDLAAKVRQMTADPARLVQMRRAARQEYLEKYTKASNYRTLKAIYDRAVDKDRDKQISSSDPVIHARPARRQRPTPQATHQAGTSR